MRFNNINKQAGLLLAHVCVFLAVIGIFLPLLPTTPFLLLAASLYLKRSKRMHSWLMNHPLFGKIVYDYMIHKSVRFRNKLIAWSMLWIGLGASIVWVPYVWLKMMLFLIGVAVSIHIYLLRTRNNDECQDTTEVNLL